MANWLAKEFDWTSGRYTGRYYDIAQAGITRVFVDSFYGTDTNAGTATAPFRTLSRAITVLNSTGANGSRIFMNGIFSETLPTQTFWYEFIGCGGGWNGKTIFLADYIFNRVIFPQRGFMRFHNIRFMNYSLSHQFITNTDAWFDIFFVNCFLSDLWVSQQNGNSKSYWCYENTIITRCALMGGSPHFIRGNKVILIDNTHIPEVHAHNSYLSSGANRGVGNIVGGEPQFIDPQNLDFNVRITSPLLGSGTPDPITGIRPNVGGVEVGLPYNGLNSEFTAAGGAVITNLTVDANGRYTITSPAVLGTLESGLMDLGSLFPIENIDVFNIFNFFDGRVNQGVFETFTAPRTQLTIRLRYGTTLAETTACPWLVIEYGKRPTFSGIGASRVGNAAPTFTPASFQTITCRFLQVLITLQNIS